MSAMTKHKTRLPQEKLKNKYFIKVVTTQCRSLEAPIAVSLFGVWLTFVHFVAWDLHKRTTKKTKGSWRTYGPRNSKH